MILRKFTMNCSQYVRKHHVSDRLLWQCIMGVLERFCCLLFLAGCCVKWVWTWPGSASVICVSQVEVSGPVASSRTPPTSSSSCTTASEAHGCSCSSTSHRFDSQGWRRRTPRCTGTSVPRTATCWTGVTSTRNVRGGAEAEDQTQNCEQGTQLRSSKDQ